MKITIKPGDELQLRQRAAILALPLAKQGLASGIEMLRFQLAYEQYAIASCWVQEVVPLRDITPLPGVPKYVLGLINVRGSITSVLDIRKFFDAPGEPLSDMNRVLLLRNDKMAFGILVDRIHGLTVIPEEAIIRNSTVLGDKRKEYIIGITSEHVICVDGNALLNDTSIVIKQ